MKMTQEYLMYFKEFSCNKTENMQARCVPRFIQRFPSSTLRGAAFCCVREGSAWRKPQSAPQEERGESEHNLWLKVLLYAAAFNFFAVSRKTATPRLGQSADFALRGRARFGEAETGGRAASRPTHIAAAGSYMLARAGQGSAD